MNSAVKDRSYVTERSAVTNLTAAWAFSEGFVGGILNAVKIPFKGLILGGISVLIITMIASLSQQRGIILRTGIVVIIIKVILSPYSSIGAYFAVFAQTVLGELFFRRRRFITASAIALGIISSALSSVQRVIIATIIFGAQLWETIDQFTLYLYSEFFGSKEMPAEFKFSQWLIIIYVIIHCIAGFLIGLLAARFSKKITGERSVDEKLFEELRSKISEEEVHIPSERKKRKFLKLTKAGIYIFLIVVLILSYTTGDLYINSKSVWTMLLRSVIITVLWFKIISPLVRMLIHKKILKSRGKYSTEIHEVMSVFPFLRKLFPFAWKSSQGRGLRRIVEFISIVLSALVYYEYG